MCVKSIFECKVFSDQLWEDHTSVVGRSTQTKLTFSQKLPMLIAWLIYARTNRNKEATNSGGRYSWKTAWEKKGRCPEWQSEKTPVWTRWSCEKSKFFFVYILTPFEYRNFILSDRVNSFLQVAFVTPLKLSSGPRSTKSPMKYHKWCFDEERALVEFVSISRTDPIYDFGDLGNRWCPPFGPAKVFWSDAARHVREATSSNFLLTSKSPATWYSFHLMVIGRIFSAVSQRV